MLNITIGAAAVGAASNTQPFVVDVIPEIPWWWDLLVHTIATALIATLAVLLNKRSFTNQELIKVRIAKISDYADCLNDIYCFYRCLGIFDALNPDKIGECKRKMERLVHVNRSLFSERFFDAHRQFMMAAFCEFQGDGVPAMLRCNLEDLKRHLKDELVRGWEARIRLDKTIDPEEFELAYRELQNQMAREIGTRRVAGQWFKRKVPVTPCCTEADATEPPATIQ